MSSNNSDFAHTFNALIDHGSSTVLISEEYALKLSLHRKCLHKSYTAELAMEKHRQKVEIKFSKYVKLQFKAEHESG